MYIFGGRTPESPHQLQGGQAMGRGRAKAKQAKVARQLKYNTPEMDLERLQRELSNSEDGGSNSSYADEDGWDDWSDKR